METEPVLNENVETIMGIMKTILDKKLGKEEFWSKKHDKKKDVLLSMMKLHLKMLFDDDLSDKKLIDKVNKTFFSMTIEQREEQTYNMAMRAKTALMLLIADEPEYLICKTILNIANNGGLNSDEE